jgi:hypothetical protein
VFSRSDEALLFGILAVLLLTAGATGALNVSAAVGAFHRDASTRQRDSSLGVNGALEERSVVGRLGGFERQVRLQITDSRVRDGGDDRKHRRSCPPRCVQSILERGAITPSLDPELARDGDPELLLVPGTDQDRE